MRKAQHSTRGFAVRFVDPWVAADRSTAFDAQLQEKKVLRAGLECAMSDWLR